MVSFQPAMQVHDDLAALFSRNLTFNPELQAQQVLSKPADHEPKQLPSDPVPDPSSSPITYSISAHYTHSAHIPRQPTQTSDQQQGQEPQRRASEPPQSEHAALEAIFVQNGLNCSVFAPSQVQLFRTSDETQRQRLLEIWKAAPPTSELDNPSVTWSNTTLEQEELWASMRYERLLKVQTQETTISLDGTQVQSSDSCWLSTSPAEPYMMSGYEELMRREEERQAAAKRAKESYSPYGSSVGHRYSHSTDPVYMNTPSGWSAQQQMQMENQYGSFQQNQFGPSGNAEAMEIM
ncbi:hypothetical protein B0T11DRAFT_276859 [Plectosphaerella cucumerina]|uniref:Uncharacterized protein n=1 Tax=Plectosphaerella cucumerina TaxID=40658 RepID=A0A8K0TPH6_9PEZI|nr:hypothetical protein B0T11DRAFT_276859 [Plectosphaerella cucumerina]